MSLNYSVKTAKIWLLLIVFFSPIVSNNAFNTTKQFTETSSNNLNHLPPSAIILQYHHIADNTPYSTSTSVALFKKQMQLLKTLGFQVWSLSKIVNQLQNGDTLPTKVVALSFDDAYSSFYSNAWPVLKSYGYPATLFVATTHISEKPTEFLSWQQLKFLSLQGIEIGSHSDSHNYLARQLYLHDTPKTVININNDLQLSLDKIKQHLDIDSKLFAYPYGEYSDSLIKIVKKLNLIGFGQHSGPINRYSNFLALPRFPASNQFGSIESLREKLFTLPFTQIIFQPSETFIALNPPNLIFRISDKTLKINCYATNQGKIPSKITSSSSFQQLNVRATKPLAKGRSRYNCTAKANDPYFYWFSQPWINL